MYTVVGIVWDSNLIISSFKPLEFRYAAYRQCLNVLISMEKNISEWEEIFPKFQGSSRFTEEYNLSYVKFIMLEISWMLSHVLKGKLLLMPVIRIDLELYRSNSICLSFLRNLHSTQSICRLQNIIRQLIHPNQTEFIYRQRSFCNVRCLINLIQLVHSKNIPSLFRFLIEWIIISCLTHYKPLVWRTFQKCVVPLMWILDHLSWINYVLYLFFFGRKMKWPSDHSYFLLCKENKLKFNFAISLLPGGKKMNLCLSRYHHIHYCQVSGI